jgi:hypothetical protein
MIGIFLVDRALSAFPENMGYFYGSILAFKDLSLFLE